MIIKKALIAQRLDEHAREGRAIVALMDDYLKDPRWAGIASDLARSSDAGEYWAKEIRDKEEST